LCRESAMNHASKADQKDCVRQALNRLQGPLVRYAMRITGDLDRARDVVQDTFLQLCSEDLSVLSERLDPWLFTVCRNRALDILRKENRMNSLTQGPIEPFDDGDRRMIASLEAAEAVSHVLKILASLPENQQEVIRLRFQNDLTYKEIGQVTGLSVSNVGFLIHTGLKTVRHQMSAQTSETKQNLRRVK
jgi:RNA polymerase sigma factor (sigma-70 family)